MSTDTNQQEQNGHCNACGVDLVERKNSYGSLQLACPSCERTRPIKIAKAPPREWDL